MRAIALLIFLILDVVVIVDGSSGDRSVEFAFCTSKCVARDCTGTVELPLILRLFHWTCLENCQYECMHNVTLDDLAHERPVRQFYGKVR